ncbi:MAG: hypothetical protein HQL43_05160 [Alphaproteobacteria bacterium]|nr:hypothetical protein [Alphaproteobacteria bacterium]
MIPPVVPPDLLQRIQDMQNTQSALTAAASAQTRSLPSDIFNLLPGSTFSATISQADARGLLTLSTDAGSFQLRLSVPQTMLPGSTMTLQLSQIGDQAAQFRILTLDGQPIAPPLGQGTQLSTAVSAAANTQGGTQAQAEAAALQFRTQNVQPAGIQATVLTPPDPTQIQQATMNEPWQPGTQLAVRIVAVSPPAPSLAMAGQAAAAVQPGSLVPPLPGTTAIAQAAATQTAGAVAAPGAGAQSQGPRDAALQFGMNTPDRQPQAPAPQAPPAPAQGAPWMSTSRDSWAPYSPTLFQTPANPSLGAPQAQVPLLLTGTVAPNTANGQPIVATGVGLLALDTGPMAPGSRLTLEVVGQPVPPQAVKAAEGFTSPYATSPMPALEEAIDLLKFSDPNGAQRLLAALPSLSPRLAANLAAYMGAVRQGDVKSWLGEQTISSIEKKGGRELIKRMESEFRELAELPKQPRPSPSGSWTSFAVPMMNGQHIEPIHLHVRQAPEEAGEGQGKGGKAGKGGGTRFVVDLELSRLGSMQIDGLMQGGERRIDFIIRTSTPLPSEMRYDLNRIVDNVSNASGLNGSIIFQANARFVETPKIEPAQTRRKPGVMI